MKKKNLSKKKQQPSSEVKTVYRQAGELIGSIGAHIALGTGRVVNFVSDEATGIKKAIKKKLGKRVVKKKKAIKNVLSKAANKTAKKTARKKSAKKGGKKSVQNVRKTASTV
jgi:hypothetical protein